MHLEHISITPMQIYEQFKDQPIDIIALTGDFLDRKRSIPRLIPYLEIFKKLQPKHGIYTVFGNHDYVLNTKDFLILKQLLEQYDCQPMQNKHERIWIDETPIDIIGIDDFSTQRSNLRAAYANVGAGHKIVLTHDPNLVLHMKDYDYEYLISGHFHGGQIHWPKPYHLAAMGKLIKLNMVKGLHFYHGKPFYISEGLGQTGVNIRVGSRPEMTLHHVYLPKVPAISAKALTAV